MILPVAGLAAGMAAFAGVGVRGAVARRHRTTTIRTQPIASAAPTTTSTTVAPEPVAPKPAVTPTPATAPTTVVPSTTPPTTAAPQTDATVPPAEQPADVPVSVAPPQPDPNDPPVSILPGETPITIIGTPDSTTP